jgi:plasmid maintenance system antidote protein VapI
MPEDNVVKFPVDRLTELVMTRLAELGEPGKPMSIREAARRSGGKVSPETIRAIVTGEYPGQLSGEVAAGLAEALGVPVETLTAAQRPPGPA